MDKNNKLVKSRSAGYLRRASTTIDVAPFTTMNFSSSECKIRRLFWITYLNTKNHFYLDLKSNMPVDTDDSIHAIHRNLQNYHECTVNELGKNFYRNYGEYVKVAKEADKFEHDLSAMRAMISQLKTFSSDITGIRDSFSKDYI